LIFGACSLPPWWWPQNLASSWQEPCPTRCCQNDMTIHFGGLQWTFSALSPTIDFMDLTISISKETVSILHLPFWKGTEPPPTSAFPYSQTRHTCLAPGVISGLMVGIIHCIHRIFTNDMITMTWWWHLMTKWHSSLILSD
jgi:hypothetical protein